MGYSLSTSLDEIRSAEVFTTFVLKKIHILNACANASLDMRYVTLASQSFGKMVSQALKMEMEFSG
jgi:hypothetical protein